ncbi:metal ABC transporter solute-binding protein, Zn/Mn family [Portibacter marinus]|uniref:metal ABC transporter solute-binding protein, Zn/Mn family n=1 Tax=Portibacter marinus TaxID=2898660 RepID=UPI001F395F11|nr:zinc ABC transporter substrate-binding protein [Portibacter marinus]
MKKLIEYSFILLLTLILTNLYGQKKTIVASASMMADMAQNIAGDLFDVKYIVPRGQDPHLYKPTPSDVVMVEKADLIIINGLTFEGWISKLIANSGTRAETKVISDGIQPITSEKYKNSYDPHAWMDVNLVQKYIDNILEALIKLDPENKETFEKNHAAYSRKLTELDQYILDKIKEIPESKRILITSHDAFAYYGRRYGLQLEAIVGISTEAEVQSSDIIRVHKVIRESEVPAIFMESTINPKILRQIAKDNKIVIGGELFADSLGEKGGQADTYLKMLKYNTDTIVKGLTTNEEVDSEKLKDSGSIGYLSYLFLALGLFAIVFFVIRKLNKG